MIKEHVMGCASTFFSIICVIPDIIFSFIKHSHAKKGKLLSWYIFLQFFPMQIHLKTFAKCDFGSVHIA